MSGRINSTRVILAVLVVLLISAVGCQCGTPVTTTTVTTTTSATTTTAPISPTTQTTTSIRAMTLYENTEHGFSIEYPEGWNDNTHGGPMSCYYISSEPEGTLSVFVSVEYRAGELVLEDAIAEIKEYMEAAPQNELFSEDYITAAGTTAYEMIGQGEEEASGLQKYRYIILVRDEQMVMVGVYGEPDIFDAQQLLLDSIIDSFKLIPYTYEPPAPSPGGTYTDEEYGFSITYPEGWSNCTTGEFAEILDLRSDAGVPEVMVRFMMGVGSLEEAVAGMQQIYSDNFPDYELISESEMTLDDGTPAYEFVFKATMQGFYITTKCVIVMRGEDAFNLMGFSPVSSFAYDEPVIDEVIGSFYLE